MPLEVSFLRRHWWKFVAAGISATVVVSVVMISAFILFQQQTKTHMQIFHAGSLTIPYSQYASAWMSINPQYLIDNEAYGSSTAINQVTQLGRRADVVGSADYSLIKSMMMDIEMTPGTNWSDWYIITSTNSMAIAYVEHNNPPHMNDLKSGTKLWWEVLNGTDITFGRADPYQDPCGYRTLMVWGLADDHYVGWTSDEINSSMYSKDPIMSYSGPGATVVKSKEVDLISALEAGEIDYLFIYTSVAVQHSLNYLDLVDHVDLSNETLKDFYANVTVSRISPLISGARASDKTAAPIQYGITIPNNAPHPSHAINYVKFILGYPGIWIENGQDPYWPYLCSNVSLLPAPLKSYCIDNPSA